MLIDWAYVKKTTLWHYDDLIKKMVSVLGYSFVQQHYNHTMTEAVAFTEKIRQGYLQNGRADGFIDEIGDHLRTFTDLGIKDYQDLLQRVDTKAKCEAFLDETGVQFEALIQVLNYIFRWVLPFRCPVKELVDTIPGVGKDELELLKRQKIRSNLDVLENFRTKRSRARFSKDTGMAKELLLELVHRADISRIAYVRGKTIKHLCGGGYDSLDKLAAADLKKMEADMAAYYASMGKSFSDFIAVIPLDWMVGGARILPGVVEG